MNKILRYILTVLALTAALVACRDEELDPWKDFRTPNGAVVSWSSINSSIINFAEINSSSYDVDLVDNTNRVAAYELFTVYRGDTATFETITDFPAKLTITAAELVTALNSAGKTIFDAGLGAERAYVLSDFNAGDRVDCFATVTDIDGTVFPVSKIGNDLLTNPGMRTMHRFNFFFSCPFDATAAAGTYFVTNDAWGDYPSNGTVPLTVTSSSSGVVIEGLYSDAWVGATGHQDYNITVTVNAANGVATVAAQDAYSTAWWPATFGVARVDGGGFVFACSGTITLNLQHRVAAGTFSGGPYNITLEKNP
jgi:hypothetical protein